MGTRLACLVPGCTHTRGQHRGEPPIRPGEQWVCGEHWRQVPTQMRRIKARAFRKARRAGTQAAWRVAQRIWRRCVRAAIERAMGV